MKIRLIVNPRAAAGSAGRRIRDISGALHGAGIAHETVHTTRPGDASRLARRAIDDAVDVIAIVGGDGTVNEVCQAYLDAEGLPVAGPDIALIPAGTGGDFRRTFGLSERLADAVERLRSGSPRPLDLGIIELEDDSGAPVRKAFVNVMSFGIGGHVDRIVNQGPKWMGGGRPSSLAACERWRPTAMPRSR